MLTTRHATRLTDDQLMDRYTPSIFLPRLPKLRASVLAENRLIEAELRSRGITRS
jgi:hypothetical protein